MVDYFFVNQSKLYRLDVVSGTLSPVELDFGSPLLCLATSPSSQLLAVTTEAKDLIICNTTEILKTFKLSKRVSVIKFKSEQEIVIADKFGDVYRLEQDELSLITGHVSMVLDLCVTNDYVITSDRDEKIRVSQYPRAFNIHSFCLGHSDLVSSICLVPNSNMLLSGGADNRIILWNYLKGTETASVELGEDLIVEKLLCTATDAFVLFENSQKVAKIALKTMEMSFLPSENVFAAFLNGQDLILVTDGTVKQYSSPYQKATELFKFTEKLVKADEPLKQLRKLTNS